MLEWREELLRRIGVLAFEGRNVHLDWLGLCLSYGTFPVLCCNIYLCNCLLSPHQIINSIHTWRWLPIPAAVSCIEDSQGLLCWLAPDLPLPQLCSALSTVRQEDHLRAFCSNLLPLICYHFQITFRKVSTDYSCCRNTDRITVNDDRSRHNSLLKSRDRNRYLGILFLFCL